MPDKPQLAQMLIANHLRDGLTVFLAAEGGWSESIDRGLVARSTAEAAELLRAADLAVTRNIVVGPYLIEITESSAGRRPLAWRESIRAFGPTAETATTA